MFKDVYHGGIVSLLYSIGSKPLQLWDKQLGRDGCIQRVLDPLIQSAVIEMKAQDITRTFISCPANSAEYLELKLPYLTVVLKNTDESFSMEVEFIDHQVECRRLRFSTFQTVAEVHCEISCIPLSLEKNWNQLNFNLDELSKRIYGTNFKSLSRVIIHANCRLRRLYVADKIYAEDQLSPEFKLYSPVKK